MKSDIVSKYVEYWDEWHQAWYNRKPNIQLIKEWSIPKRKNVLQYFPEPYWGNPISKKNQAVFLNINPGAGGKTQIISMDKLNKSDVARAYTKRVYSQAVRILTKEKENETTKWMIKYRGNWAKNLLSRKSVKMSNIFCADLIPWHSASQTMQRQYILDSSTLIYKYTILPLIAIAKSINGPMKNKVIARGSISVELFNKLYSSYPVKDINEFVIVDSCKTLSKFNSFLTTFKLDEVTFFIFSGGSSMYLPNVNYKPYQIKGDCESQIKYNSIVELILNWV